MLKTNSKSKSEPEWECEPRRRKSYAVAWNEYINILSVVRNQISVWFIELIYGFLLFLLPN